MLRLAQDHLKIHFIEILFSVDNLFSWLGEAYNKDQWFWSQIEYHYSVFRHFFRYLVRDNTQPFDPTVILDVYYMTMILYLIRLAAQTGFESFKTGAVGRPITLVRLDSWKVFASCGINLHAVSPGTDLGNSRGYHFFANLGLETDLPEERVDDLRPLLFRFEAYVTFRVEFISRVQYHLT